MWVVGDKFSKDGKGQVVRRKGRGLGDSGRMAEVEGDTVSRGWGRGSRRPGAGGGVFRALGSLNSQPTDKTPMS